MHPVGERHAAPGVALAIRTGYRQNSERLQVCHCEAPAGPWQSREGTADANQLPIKWYAPIASAAALIERLWQLQMQKSTGAPWHSPDVSFRGAKRRGNLAVPWWITGRLWRKRNCLPEIATSAVGLLAMTIRGHSRSSARTPYRRHGCG